MSKVKTTLLMILQQQIKDLQSNIQKMDQQSLIKQVAKNKVIYKINNRQNYLQLVYSCIALAENYVENQMYESGLKILSQAKVIKETGDSEYLTAVCLFKMGKKVEAGRIFKECLEKEWIQPTLQHREACQLESISYMQQIQYTKLEKHQQKKQEIKAKLIDLSYQKIKLIQKFDHERKAIRNDFYYSALAMGDLAEIYFKFNDYLQAFQKIKSAIKVLKGEVSSTQKLIEFYFNCSKFAQKLKMKVQVISALRNVNNLKFQAIELIENQKKSSKVKFIFSKLHEKVYYMYIKSTLQV